MMTVCIMQFSIMRMCILFDHFVYYAFLATIHLKKDMSEYGEEAHFGTSLRIVWLRGKRNNMVTSLLNIP